MAKPESQPAAARCLARMTPTRSLVLAGALAACGGPTPPAPGAPAASPAPRGEAPCFPDRAELLAADLYHDLEDYAAAFLEPETAPKPRSYGTCVVSGGAVRDPAGPVAELGCGVRILRRGIVDDLGLQIGARGQDVLDRKPAPVPELRCFANGPDQVRCAFDRREDEDTDATAYVVAGALGEDALVGAPAVAFFAARELVEIDFSVWCH